MRSAELTFSWTVEVAPDTTRCAASNADREAAQTVRVTVTDLTGATPAPPADLFAEFQVACADAAAASSTGRELVPDSVGSS